MPALDTRQLNPQTDRGRVADLLLKAQDYYLLWKGRPPSDEEVDDFFDAGPPGCDPKSAYRLGLFDGADLCGVAELSFGFPEKADAYLGLMILDPNARSKGYGAFFLEKVEDLARSSGAPCLYLAVLEANPRGRAFWERMGFMPTGVMRETNEDGLQQRIYRLKKPL